MKFPPVSRWLPLLLLPSFPLLVSGTPANWVSVGRDNRLVYAADARGNRIPDFSNCGYAGGGVPIPLVPVKMEVNPAPGDAGARIQAAIDAVSRLPVDAGGFRGAVLLHKGTYPIAGEIHIAADGVVLRGEGQGDGGTLLLATGNIKRSLINLEPSGRSHAAGDDDETEGPAIDAAATKTSASIPITDSYVPVGAYSFHVQDASAVRVGEMVNVFRPSTANWIHDLGMDRIPQNKEGSVKEWTAGSKDLLFRRRVTAVAGTLVTVEAPICCALDANYGGGKLIVGYQPAAIRHCGVENLRGDSEYRGPTDEAHGWTLVDIAAARDSWVRNVTSIHFGYGCVDIHPDSTADTAQDCECLDPISKIEGKRRYSFKLDGQLCLVLRCHARNGRHDFVMHAIAPGPNAFVDCHSDSAHADSGPHERWSVGVLYDNVVVHGAKGKKPGGDLNIRNRGNMGTGHGWAGANQVLWNCKAESINVEQPPTAQNWAIGCVAKALRGNGYFESKGRQVLPHSLYRAQLTERLGSAVANAILGAGS